MLAYGLVKLEEVFRFHEDNSEKSPRINSRAALANKFRVGLLYSRPKPRRAKAVAVVQHQLFMIFSSSSFRAKAHPLWLAGQSHV
jgi:hypothetical protein